MSRSIHGSPVGPVESFSMIALRGATLGLVLFQGWALLGCAGSGSRHELRAGPGRLDSAAVEEHPGPRPAERGDLALGKAAPRDRLPPDGFVDRVEGGLAVIVTDDLRVVHWPSRGLEEGDVLRDGRPDPLAREVLRARVEALRSRLSEGDDTDRDLDL